MANTITAAISEQGNAVQRVLDTAELLEAILLPLRLTDLHKTMRVSKAWKAAILASPSLRAHLNFWKNPAKTSKHLWNPHSGKIINESADTFILHPAIQQTLNGSRHASLYHINRDPEVPEFEDAEVPLSFCLPAEEFNNAKDFDGAGDHFLLQPAVKAVTLWMPDILRDGVQAEWTNEHPVLCDEDGVKVKSFMEVRRNMREDKREIGFLGVILLDLEKCFP